MLSHFILNLKEREKLLSSRPHLPSLHIVGYADASFANNEDLTSQLGFVVLLKEKSKTRLLSITGHESVIESQCPYLGQKLMPFVTALNFIITLLEDLSLMLPCRTKTLIFTYYKSLVHHSQNQNLLRRKGFNQTQQL